MTTKPSILFALLAGFAAIPLPAQGPPVLLADIGTAPLISGSQTDRRQAPYGVLLPGGRLVFPARNDGVGVELYSSFGFPGTTAIVRDINPGPSSSRADGFTVIGAGPAARAYFFASTAAAGRELWKTDGTLGNTSLVADVIPGVGSAAIPPFGDTLNPGDGAINELGGMVIFLAHGAAGVYTTDGTAAGTSLLKQFMAIGFDNNAGYFLGNEVRRQLVNVGGNLLFAASDGDFGMELWKTDGTPAGTVLVRDINPGLADSNPSGFAVIGGELWFRANDGVNGTEVWKSDGTNAGTVMVANLAAGADSSNPAQFVPVGTEAAFIAQDGLNPVVYEVLYKSDGTGAGTAPIGGQPTSQSINAWQLRELGAGVVFSVSNNGLWQTDGTSMASLTTFNVNRNLSQEIGGMIYLSSGPNDDQELWATDGTPLGTALVDETFVGAPNPFSLVDGPRLIHETLLGVMFWARDDVHGFEAWGAGPGIGGPGVDFVFLDDINPPNPLATSGSSAREDLDSHEMITSGGLAYISALGDLWTSDGTPAGTSMLTNVGAGELTSVNGTVFFTGDDGVNGTELWKTDGTVAGTVMVHDIDPAGGSDPLGTTGLNGKLIFSADDGTNGRELWSSDGTAPGTFMITDNPGGNSVGGSFTGTTLLTHKNEVFFFADDGSGIDRELFKTDGTALGTILVKDINPAGSSAPGPGAFGGSLTGFASAGDNVFFKADDGTNGTEIWVTDGTDPGTVMLGDIAPGPASTDPALYPVGDKIFFYADDGTNGTELWTSDGTPGGTQMVIDLNPGPASALIELNFSNDAALIVDFNGEALFVGTDGTTGVELWKTDGTAAGTSLVADIEPGAGNSSPTNLRSFGSRFVYFVATTGAFGSELWRTDGTAAGTSIVADVVPGSDGMWTGFMQLYGALHALNGKIITSVNHPVFKIEPWAIPVGAMARNVGYDETLGGTGTNTRRPGTYGQGCAGVGFLPPRLTSTDPVLGGSFTLSVSEADPSANSVLWIGLPIGAPVAAPAFLGRCVFWTDPIFFAAPFTTDPLGEFTFPAVPVPASPGTLGLTLSAQVLVVGPSGDTPPFIAPDAIAGTNAVYLTAGF